MISANPPKYTDVVGIVPVVSEPTGFNLDWDDTLIPIAPNFYAVERAVLECAYAGCTTIWIVANDDTTPLIRHRMGDYVQDPVYVGRMDTYPATTRKTISLYYAPIHLDHENKKWCIAWSILDGARTAYNIHSEISKWTAPRKFYVAFPFGVTYPDVVRQHRRTMAKTKEDFLFFHEGKSVLTGDQVSFSFNLQQMHDAIALFEDEEVYFGEDDKEYYRDNYSLDKVFSKALKGQKEIVELPWFYQIDSWDKYCKYMASEERREMRHPGKLILSYREYSPIGRDVEKVLDEED